MDAQAKERLSTYRASRKRDQAAEGIALSELESTMTPGDRARLASVPQKHLSLYKRALVGGVSAKAMIRAFCQQCVGYQEMPQAIQECTARGCPLWMKRPYQNKKAP